MIVWTHRTLRLLGILLGGALSGYATWRLFQQSAADDGALAPPGVKELLQVIAGIEGVLVGFLATAKSILFSSMDNRSVREIKENNWRSFTASIVLAIRVCFATALFSACLLLLVDRVHGEWLWVGGAAWGAVCGWSFAEVNNVISNIQWLLNDMKSRVPPAP